MAGLWPKVCWLHTTGARPLLHRAADRGRRAYASHPSVATTYQSQRSEDVSLNWPVNLAHFGTFTVKTNMEETPGALQFGCGRHEKTSGFEVDAHAERSQNNLFSQKTSRLLLKISKAKMSETIWSS